MTVSPVTPARLLAGLHQLSNRFQRATADLQRAREAWDNANTARMEAEAAEEVNQQAVEDLAAEEQRLDQELMQLHEWMIAAEDEVEASAEALSRVIAWPPEQISEAIVRLDTKIGLRPHTFVDGRELQDLRAFTSLVLRVDKLDWPCLPSLSVSQRHDTVTNRSQDEVAETYSPLATTRQNKPTNGEPGKYRTALWPEILSHLRVLMDSGNPCPKYEAIQRKFGCGSTPVEKAFKKGREEDKAFELWCELGTNATVMPELDVLDDPELLDTFNEYAGAMRLTPEAHAESLEKFKQTPKKTQQQLIDRMKQELSTRDD